MDYATQRAWPNRLLRTARAAAAGALLLGLGALGHTEPGLDSALAREAAALRGTFRSAVIVANPRAAAASVRMNFVRDDGTMALTQPLTFTVPAGASVQQYVPNIPSLADGRYSVVIESDQSVVPIANVTSDGPITSTAYNGILETDAGTTFNIPSVYRNYFGFTSNIIVQNFGRTAANVTIQYKGRTGATIATEQRVIPASAAATVDQGETGGLTDGYAGSAVVTADQPVAAMFLVSQTNPSAGLSSGRGVRAGSPSANLPVIYKGYHGYDTSVNVQNVDTAATTVTIEYVTGSGSRAATESVRIEPGASALFYQPNSALPTGFAGSAVVSSDDGLDILAVANVALPSMGYIEAYNGFQPATATTKVNCASIMNNYFNYSTSMTIQNVDTVETNLTVTYVNAQGQTISFRSVANLGPGGSALFYSPGSAEKLPNGFLGAAIVQSSGGKIVGVVNELFGSGDQAGDQLFTYSCVNS